MPESTVNITMSPEVTEAFNGLKTSLNTVKDDTLKAVNKVKEDLSGSLDQQNTRLDGMEESLNTMSLQVRNAADDDPKRGFKNHIEFYNAVMVAAKNGLNPEKMPKNLVPLFNAVGSDEARVSSNPDGAFQIPPAFLPGVKETDPQALQNDTGMMTMSIPMETDTVYMNARVDKDHSSSVSGGIRVYRRAEAETVNPSKMKFEQIELHAVSLMGISYATEEVLERSPSSFSAILQRGFNDERISKLNYERIWGSGVGEYLGFMNSDSLITVAKEDSQTADTINGTNLIKMKMRCWGYNNAVWMANQDTELQLTSAHVALTNTDLIKLYNPDTQRLLGRPVLFDENMATVGDLGDLSLVNWNEYLEGQLGGTTFADSVHVRFIYHERCFKFVMYNDGAPWWRSPLTPKKSSNTLSPFVTLAKRA